MKTALRDYQLETYYSARKEIAVNKAVLIQGATGSGKTPIASAMVSSVFEKNKRAWFITPRRDLVNQASGHFRKWGVPHGLINASNEESRAYNIHVVSKDTLVRRWDKIKNWPDLIIIDEAHLNFDFQLELFKRAPEYVKFIGYTATPQRTDGRGLSVKGGGIYNSLILGAPIPFLTNQGYLSPFRYFAPPIDGLQNIKSRGSDLDEEQLEDLLQRRKVWGEVVGHYEKRGKGKPALGFCRSVKSAYQTAERFRDKGFNFHCVEGSMPDKKRRDLIQALTAGTIDGLTTCDLVLYGYDIPRIEYAFSVRPTLSFSLFMQMIGRILRPFAEYEMMQNESGLWIPDYKRLKYKKEDAIWMDHVNMIIEHGIEIQEPGMKKRLVPPHEMDYIDWNFDGTEKKKRDKNQRNIMLCPHLDFMYCQNPRCSTCKDNPDKNIIDARQPMIIVPAELQEIKKPVPLSERSSDERKIIQDRISQAVLDYKNNMLDGAVGALLKIADELGYRELWVYHRLTDENRYTINVPLLHEIQRQRGYKSGWVFFAMKKIKAHKSLNNEYDKVMEG